MEIYSIIKKSLVSLIKSEYPDIDVFAEEISKTDEENEAQDISNYFFIDFVPVGCTTVDLYTTAYSILVDIVCCLESEKNADYMAVSHKLDSVIRPVFCFEDRAITIYSADMKIVDRLLHYSFSLNFHYQTKDLPILPLMEEVYTQFKERI